MLSWYISTDTDAASCSALRNLRKAVSEQKTEAAHQVERAKVARDAAADGSSKATAEQRKVEALLSKLGDVLAQVSAKLGAATDDTSDEKKTSQWCQHNIYIILYIYTHTHTHTHTHKHAMPAY